MERDGNTDGSSNSHARTAKRNVPEKTGQPFVDALSEERAHKRHRSETELKENEMLTENKDVAFKSSATAREARMKLSMIVAHSDDDDKSERESQRNSKLSYRDTLL